MALSAYDIQESAADTVDAGLDLVVDSVSSPAGGSVAVTKLANGAAGSMSLITDSNPLQVEVFDVNGTMAADITAIKTAVEVIDNAISGSEMQVDIVSGTVTANLSATDNAVLDAIAASLVDVETNTNFGAVTGGGVEASALRVTLANDSTGVVTVDDGGGSLTVDGTVTANAGTGTFTVDASGTTVPVSNAGLTELAAAINSNRVDVNIAADGVGIGGGTQYAVDAALGATPTGTLAVGIRDDALSSLTPVEGDAVGLRVDANGALWVIPSGTVTVDGSGVTQPVSGTVTANLGATDNAVLDAIQTATEATQAAVEGTLTVGSHAVTNAGTFAVQVDGDALTSLQLIDDAVVAEGGALGKGVLLQGDDGTDRKNLNVDATTGDLQVDVTNTVTVDGSGVTQPVSGTVTANLSATDNAVLDAIQAAVETIDNAISGSEMQVDVVTSALPTGAATAANQATGNGSLADIETNTDFGATTGGGTEAGALRVTVASDSTGVLSIDDNGGSITVDGTVDLGATDNAVLDQIVTNTTGLAGTVSGSELQVDIVGALPAGTNAIGKLAANSGVDIGDVDVTSVVPGTGASNLGKAEDAAHSSGDVGVMPLAVRNDDLAALAGADGDYAPLQVTQNGALLMCPAANDDYKYAVIDEATSGNNTLVAAVASRKIRVLAYVMVASGDVTARFEDGAGGTALTGQMDLTTNSGVSAAFNPAGWFETGTNTLLNLELDAAVSVDGHLTYIEVP